MKARLITALALSLALSQFTVTAASAETAGAQASHFRTATARTFSADDLQRYGLDANSASRIEALQSQGYHVQVMTPAEAQRVHGGQFSTTTWIIIGLIVVVVIVAASN